MVGEDGCGTVWKTGRSRCLDYFIVGTDYGVPSNPPKLEGLYGENTILFSNVDATRLDTYLFLMSMDFDAVVFNNPRAIDGWNRETMSLIDGVLQSALSVLKFGGKMLFSGTWKMPGSPYLYHLVEKWPPPQGYSNSYQMEYYADPLFGVTYNAITNDGKPLRRDLLFDSQWYVFVK